MLPSDDLLAVRLTPDIAEFVRALRALPGPALSTLPVADARRRFANARAGAPRGPDMASVEDDVLPVEGLATPLRRYEPANQRPGTIVYLHGGGWTLGSIEVSDASARALADAIGMRLISVDYALSPEHRHPVALHQTLAVVAHAAARYREPVVLAGESAGANLAAAAAVRLAGIAAQVLIYPVLDHACHPSAADEQIADLVLSRRDMARFWDNHVPDAMKRGTPAASPLRGDLSSIPPTFVAVAEHDVLRGEAEAYAARAAAAERPVSLRCYPGTVHGFFSSPARFTAARTLLRDIGGFIDNHVDRPGADR